VPVEPDVAPKRYQLIDLGRFSPETPVSRDPMKLLLSVAADWLPSLAAGSSIRSSLAELMVAPRRYPAAPAVAGYRTVVERIHEAAESWSMTRQLAHDWSQQNLLVLIACALRFAAQDKPSLTDRCWFFEVAALATRAFLQPDTRRDPPLTLPSMRRISPPDDSRPLVGVATPTPPPSVEREPATRFQLGTPELNGSAKLDVCRRLGDDWRDLADVFQIRPHERSRFPRGEEPREIWDWLELRGRLGELRGALLSINRPDLAQRLDGTT
jgi:hypothetical protein